MQILLSYPLVDFTKPKRDGLAVVLHQNFMNCKQDVADLVFQLRSFVCSWSKSRMEVFIFGMTVTLFRILLSGDKTYTVRGISPSSQMFHIPAEIIHASKNSRFKGTGKHLILAWFQEPWNACETSWDWDVSSSTRTSFSLKPLACFVKFLPI